MTTFYNTNLPGHLRVLKDEIEGYAKDYGLDFYETIFEVVDADDLNEIAAYGGFPTRYPHWSFGMSYEELKKGYDYGLSKIYEMVINNDPCYAYLMRCNHMVDQKLVMAHVYGHCDFFKHNAFFGHTNRKMMDDIANHAARIRDYAERFGEDEVEAFMDRCMSIDDLIDIHSVAIKRRDDHSKYDFTSKQGDDGDAVEEPKRFKSKDYMDDYINPKDAYHDEREAKKKQPTTTFPDHPEKDVLLFLIEHAPLRNWQRDILSIIRDEAYYFTPQGQTKIMNEGWACMVPGSLVLTDAGILPVEEIVRKRLSCSVSDGERTRSVADFAAFEERDTIRIQTRRGLIVEGSLTHRLLLPDGNWLSLAEMQIGQKILVARGQSHWAHEIVKLDWTPRHRTTLDRVANEAGVSIWTVLRHRAGKRIRKAELVGAGLANYDREYRELPFNQYGRVDIRIPTIVDENFASFLGYLTGDGHISDKKRVIGLTTGDTEQADRFSDLVKELFGIEARKKDEGNKVRILFSSRTVQDFLAHLGLPTGFAARRKKVPECILRSPERVVSAFLRSLYDCDGYAGKAGVILATSSEEMSRQVQLLLLNFGALSTRRPHKDGCWHVHTTGRSAETFERKIGFGLRRKQNRLRDYLGNRSWFKRELESDRIVSVQQGRSPVFDITVDETHRYVAQGVVNHNSYWHSTIMTQKVLQPSEVIDYADHHSGTMAMSGGRLNPYKLGIELLRDVEERWNKGRFGPEYDDCDDLDVKRQWNKETGLGRQKIFEVRRVHNDITFIDTFLTPEFCRRHKLFSFGYNDTAEQYLIESREFANIKQRLLFSLTNFGKPWIVVVNGNHRNRGELLLKHIHGGMDLKLDTAKDTLANLQFMWNRPVHLETLIDGKASVLSFDGTEHSVQPMGENDDGKRKPDGKTK